MLLFCFLHVWLEDFSIRSQGPSALPLSEANLIIDFSNFSPDIVQSAPRNVKRLYYALHPTLSGPERIICKHKSHRKDPKGSGPDKMLYMALMDLGKIALCDLFYSPCILGDSARFNIHSD